MMEKRTFLIAQTVEMNAVNDVFRYDQPLENGDGGAHEWRVTVRRNRVPVDLTGMTARCLITRAASSAEREKGIASVTVYMEAQVSAAAGEVSCVFDAGCYAGVGSVAGTMLLVGEDGQSTTVARMSARTSRTASDVMADPDDLVMSLGEIEVIAKEVRETSAAATEALENVAAEQASWVNATAEAETLEPGSAAKVELGEDENGNRKFLFGMPKGEKGDQGVPGAVYSQFSFVLPADGWSEAGDLYYQSVEVEGMANAPGTLHLDTENVSKSDAEAMSEQFALIRSAKTWEGRVQVYAYERLDRDIPVIAGVFAWEA